MNPSPQQLEVPACRDCAHLIGVRHQVEFAKGWQCGAPANILAEHFDPVVGQVIRQYKYLTCYAAREGDCGPPGTWYVKYELPHHDSRAVTSVDNLLARMEM